MKKSKKLFLLFLFTVLALMGCTPAQEDVKTTESDGTEVTTGDFGISKLVHSIPYNDLTYEEATFSLKSIEMYQDKDSKGYSPYIVVRFDLSTMESEWIYQIFKDYGDLGQPTFDLSAYLTCEKNDVKYESMPTLRMQYDDTSALCIFYLSDYYPYSFDESSFDIKLSLKQKDTYMYENKKRNQLHMYRWNVNDENNYISIPVSPAAEMPSDVAEGIQKGYQRLIERWSK